MAAVADRLRCVETFWTIVGSALAGAFIAMVVRYVMDRGKESRGARRTFYVDLLTLLQSCRAYIQRAVFDPAAIRGDVPNERIDELTALLQVDATDAVRSQANVCFELLNRFEVAHSLRVPVEVDERGLYHHRFDQLTDLPVEMRDVLVRESLGALADDFAHAVDVLGGQVRREVHGPAARPRRNHENVGRRRALPHEKAPEPEGPAEPPGPPGPPEFFENQADLHPNGRHSG